MTSCNLRKSTTTKMSHRICRPTLRRSKVLPRKSRRRVRKEKKVENQKLLRSAPSAMLLTWSLTLRFLNGLESASARLKHGEFKDHLKHLPRSQVLPLFASLVKLMEHKRTTILLRVFLKVVKKAVKVKAALLIKRLAVQVSTNLFTGSQITSWIDGLSSQISLQLISRLQDKLKFYSREILKDQFLQILSSSVERNTILELKSPVLFIQQL